MKRNFFNIGRQLFVFVIFAMLLCSYSWAISSEVPTVIRKKIVEKTENPQDKNRFRAAVIGQKTPALKPESEITLIPKDTTDDLTVPANSRLSQNTHPVYNPKGKTDPFQPLFEDKPQINKDKLIPVDAGRKSKTALEKIDLSQLRLTGIVLAAGGNKGLVQEASGRGHVISEGTYIGTLGGRVSSIQKGKVIVEERMKDVYGKIYTSEKELKLNKVD